MTSRALPQGTAVTKAVRVVRSDAFRPLLAQIATKLGREAGPADRLQVRPRLPPAGLMPHDSILLCSNTPHAYGGHFRRLDVLGPLQ